MGRTSRHSISFFRFCTRELTTSTFLYLSENYAYDYVFPSPGTDGML